MLNTVEQVKDNQWWYSKSDLRPDVESSSLIELSIEGRRCILERSADGKDGRKTLSFKFVRDDDRIYWQSLNGSRASIELVDVSVSQSDLDEDQEDEYVQSTGLPFGSMRIEADVSSDRSICLSGPKPIFDAYIFVDWSASNRPTSGKDSIWIAEGYWDDQQLSWGSQFPNCINAKTRHDAIRHIRERLIQHHTIKRRVLLCFDFAYAYPECPESAKFGGEFGEAAAEFSSQICDDTNNESNRFKVASDLNEKIESSVGEGPFWGRPTSGYAKDLNALKTTKPKDWKSNKSLKEFRVVETRLRECGQRPFSVWQLFGNGSVGSQVLLGIPRVHALRHDAFLSKHSAVWPFETGWVTSFNEQTRIVHAEFWPGAIKIDASLHPVKDASQVLSCVEWAAKADAEGSLGTFFDPILETDKDRDLAKKEGWILGFTDRKRPK